MNLGDYKELAVKYLRLNRGRSIVTIIGVMITVMLLYGGLNLAYSYLLHTREEVRQESDYDFVVMAESRAQADQIIADELIDKAYMGKYEYIDWETFLASSAPLEKKLYSNAVYATCKNPYLMTKYMNDIKARYCVNAELNEDLAPYYFQGDEDAGSGFVALVIAIILVAYIFAIFAVGIIRNTVQMFLMEQVRDYGILRCVGATKGQLRRIIYLMGAILELTGIGCGIVLGGLTTTIMGIFMGVKSGYHVIPAIPVLICYLGDLYFVMQENAKVITGMSPISAVRGEFRIKKTRIRIRGKGILGTIFGMEGEYARKSVLRNRKRYVKTVASLSVSISALVAVMSIAGGMDQAVSYADRRYGPYPVFLYDNASPIQSIEEVESKLPDAERLQRLSDKKYVTAARKVYESEAYVADIQGLCSRYTDDYLNKAYSGNWLKSKMEKFNIDKDAPDNILLASVRFRGLDDEGIKELEKYLVAGTVQVDENGIVVLSGESVRSERTVLNENAEYEVLEHIWATDFKVGDTINIVDTRLLYSETQKAIKKADSENEIQIAKGVYDRLVAEGHYRSYKVEGILDMGDMVDDDASILFYTTLDNYMAETGYTENQISGMEYEIDSSKVSNSELNDIISVMYTEYDSDWNDAYMYIDLLRTIGSLKSFNKVIMVIAAFVFSLGAVNMINATAGNLHMRRKEFAQLRVIGMSRKRLIKTVLLEGIMAVVMSNIIGTVIGTGIYYGEYYFLRLLINLKFAPSIPAILIGCVMSAVLVFGSIYVPIRKLPQSMAEDLTLEE